MRARDYGPQLEKVGFLSTLENKMLIARRTLKTRTENKVFDVLIFIFAPVQLDKSWSCLFEIGWSEHMKQMTVQGVDSVQAIELALQFVGISLYTSPYLTVGQ
jgi:hypothetical protein